MSSARAAALKAAPETNVVAAPKRSHRSPASALAMGYADEVAALKSVGNLNGKVVIDITNPLTADLMGLSRSMYASYRWTSSSTSSA